MQLQKRVFVLALTRSLQNRTAAGAVYPFAYTCHVAYEVPCAISAESNVTSDRWAIQLPPSPLRVIGPLEALIVATFPRIFP